MTTLVAVVYKDAATANAALAKLRDLSNQYLIELEDAVIVTKDQQGKIQLHQSVNLTAAGATSGAFWGMLIGLIFFIPIGGLVIGAVMGALGGKLSDYGIDDNFAKKVSSKLEPGKAALFLMVRQVTTDKVLPEMAQFGGEILQSNLDKDADERIQAALNNPAPPEA